MKSQFYEVLSAKTTEELKSMVDNMSDDYAEEAIKTALKILVERGETVHNLLRSAQLRSCSRCKHRKTSEEELICGITDSMAEFVGSCPSYKCNETEGGCFTCKHFQSDGKLCGLTNASISSIDGCDGYEQDEERIEAAKNDKADLVIEGMVEGLIEEGSTKEEVVQNMKALKYTEEKAEELYERALEKNISFKTMLGTVMIVLGIILTFTGYNIFKSVFILVGGVGYLLGNYFKKKE